MKKNLLAVLTLLLLAVSNARAGIDSLKVIPANPTTTDNIQVLVYSTFSSSGCERVDSTLTRSGNTFTAVATHCMGTASALCNAVDTFGIGQLPSGSYSFSMTILATVQPLCNNPVAWPANTTFTVAGTESVKNVTGDNVTIAVAYNSGRIYLPALPAGLGAYDVRIMSMNGQTVLSSRQARGTKEIAVSLPAGMYIVLISDGRQRLAGKLVAQ